jgi:hypothetical protein
VRSTQRGLALLSELCMIRFGESSPGMHALSIVDGRIAERQVFGVEGFDRVGV